MLFGDLVDNWSRIRSGLGRVRAYAYLGVAAALVLIAPFGTVGEPWLWRLGYWMIVIGIFDLALLPAALAGVQRIAWLQSLPYSVGLLLMPLVLAVPMTAIVITVDYIFFAVFCRLSPVDGEPYGAELAAACASFPGVATLEMYGNVLAICVLAGGLLFLCTGGFKAFSPRVDTVKTPGLRLLSRLPAHVGGEIRYLQMQDHYLRVVTDKGEAMILMPLRDAVAELEDVEGLQVHRSWWIALGALVRLSKDGRKTVAIMSDGASVPVSETYRAALRERVGM